MTADNAIASESGITNMQPLVGCQPSRLDGPHCGQLRLYCAHQKKDHLLILQPEQRFVAATASPPKLMQAVRHNILPLLSALLSAAAYLLIRSAAVQPEQRFLAAAASEMPLHAAAQLTFICCTQCPTDAFLYNKRLPELQCGAHTAS
jgi:hypothetical protein